ncbi:MAG: DUF349 domain-containing protein [Bacteroidia bacterium]|nr:DUF349 domain-containing protein [Bacteroidia bacterium]
MSDLPELFPENTTPSATETEREMPTSEISLSSEESLPSDLANTSLHSETDLTLPEAHTQEIENASVSESSETEEVHLDAETLAFQEIKQEQHKAIQNILEESDINHILETAGIKEIMMLMQALAETPIQEVRNKTSKVGEIKRSFDKKKQEESEFIKTIADEEKRRAEQDKFNEISRSFSASLAKFNATKVEYEKVLEAEKADNTNKKEELLGQLKEIVAKEDLERDAEVRNIQQQWKEIGPVINEKSENIIQTYRTLLDQFYALRKKRKDLEDIDRQRNLEAKESLIKEVLTLIPENATEVNGAYWRDNSEKVKNIHEVWKLVGPVPSEVSDEVWNRFKQATDAFYDVRKEYYVQQDSLRLENAKLKQEIMTQLTEAIGFEYQTIDEWKQATERIFEMQKNWMAVGETPLELSGQLWKEYRDFCNKFFAAKSTFFDALDSIRKEHLKQKLLIIEQVEALQESIEWKKTATTIQQLQQQWKTIPYSSHKESEKLWKRFRKACDTFFKRKSEHFESAKQSELENLTLKQEICARVESFLTEDFSEDHTEEIKELQAKWKEIGLVPIKEKELIWQRFRKACDNYFEGFYKQKRANKPFHKNNYRRDNDTNYAQRDNSKPLSEERKIKDKIRLLEEKISQYENNILFISKGSSGDKLREVINAQITQTKSEAEKLNQTLKELKNAASNVDKPTEHNNPENTDTKVDSE